jgi:hypothetical protein
MENPDAVTPRQRLEHWISIGICGIDPVGKLTVKEVGQVEIGEEEV